MPMCPLLSTISHLSRMPPCSTNFWDRHGVSTVCKVCELTFNNGRYFYLHIYWIINPKCTIYS